MSYNDPQTPSIWSSIPRGMVGWGVYWVDGCLCQDQGEKCCVVVFASGLGLSSRIRGVGRLSLSVFQVQSLIRLVESLARGMDP